MSSDSTVDPREVEYYTRMADTWWDTQGPFWPLHTLNTLRVEYIRRKLCERFDRHVDAAQPLEGLRILDVGCGGGILSESMAALGATVTGIDVVERNIAVARLHAQAQPFAIDYHCSSASALVADGLEFDVVLNMEVVEHVADLPAFMRDCARLTAEAGVMFVATINRTWLAWFIAIIGAEYVLRLLPRGTHRWRLFRKPQELSGLLAREAMSVDAITGVKVNPFARRMTFSSMTAVNYMLMASRERATS